jgi:glycosyltransferase involved in cell wall biosynthesis
MKNKDIIDFYRLPVRVCLMNKMRILQVFPAFGTGGVEEGALAVSQALVQAGHSSYIASAGGYKVLEAVGQGAVHITLPLNIKSPLIFFKMVGALSAIIREHNIDIIHARSRWPAWCAYFAAKRCGIPFMTTFHGYHKSHNMFKSLYNSIMVRARHTIAVSNFMSEYIQNTYGRTLKKYHTTLHTIPRGIDEVRFNPVNVADVELEDLRKAWNVQSDVPLILLPARMTSMKGHSVLIDALPLVKNQNWKVVLVGGQAERMSYQLNLEQKIKDLGLSEKVRIVAAIQNIPAAYKLADVIVHPAIQPEAFGRVIIEAQAMGKPIITSNVGEPANVVKHGTTGWQFESRNPASLAKMLDKVLSLTKEDRSLLAQIARHSVLKNYTKALMCKRTLEVYETVYAEGVEDI